MLLYRRQQLVPRIVGVVAFGGATLQNFRKRQACRELAAGEHVKTF
jgi:hypothetical protein